MPLEAQTRLLRVLQDGTFTTIGGRSAIHTNVRIVAATHRDLRQVVSQGLFREDLYYRLNVVPLRLPPLRQRSEDIPDLVRYFFSQGEKQGLPAKLLDPDAMNRLRAHNWPGNVRELENLIRRLAALYSEEHIGMEIIEAELAEATSAEPGVMQLSSENLSEAVERHLQAYFDAHGDALPSPGMHERVVREVERPLISLCLAATRGNQIRAAELLGVNRNTLRKKIRELDIQVVRGVK
jgi:two-component system nitrogen regulation response regulator GlnG